MNEQNMLYIKILAPVHIGCDEVYEPAGFVINEQAAVLTSFDPLDFFRSLDAQTKGNYSAICRKGTIESILELYKFMKGKHFSGHSVGVCKGLLAQYQKTLGIPLGDRRKIQQELNNFSISRTSFNPLTQKPYIPGTAIKGALRTAYLNALAKGNRISLERNDRRKGETLEKKLLGYNKIEEDPFRLLKVSDFHPVGPCPTKIVYAVNEKKKESSRFEARGPYQILEIIEPGAVFAGTVQVLAPLARGTIKNPLEEEKLFNSAKEFYSKEMNREKGELETAGIKVFNVGNENGAIPLRLGRHSGAESITVEGYRNIKILKKKGEKPDFEDKATTFWLASDVSTGYQKNHLRPFGWVSLGKMTQSMKDELESLTAKQDDVTDSTSIVVSPPNEEAPKPGTPAPPPVEETWHSAYVNYSPGGGGILTAQSADERKAQIHGKDKAINATDQSLHKKIFESKKRESKAHVTVRKIGNAWIIVKVEPAA